MNARYEEFLKAVRERKHLSAVSSLLNWDEQVNLPHAAADGRAEQLSALARVIHEKNTDPAYVELVRELDTSTELSADARCNVREVRRDIERALKIPGELVSAISLAESQTFARWLEARQKNSYAHVRQDVERLLKLKKELAAVLQPSGRAYDAMLDLFEPGLTADETSDYFDRLRPSLTGLLQRLSSAAAEKNPARGTFPKDAQQTFCRFVAETMGFDFNRGRFDVAVHPFCSEMGFDDIRMTTRYFEDDFVPALYGTMHETGHGLYDLGYSRENAETPLGEYCSMAIHESQSRLWENIVGRSRGFVEYLLPHLQQAFPAALRGVGSEQLYRYITRVSPSLIRVEADEVSYGLHIIIRFELERDLFSAALDVKDIAEAWNAKYEEYLGVTPPDDLQGVLQDVHWYSGGFGYFPTYLLGSSYAAQIYAKAEKDLSQLAENIQAGKLLPLKQWLNENIHRHGKRYSAKELIHRSTGEEPNPQYMIEYLERKYQERLS
jgi:carboxypeptidase Taq